MRDAAIGSDGAVPVHALAGAGPVVVLAPHPDDETLGCGGLLAAAFAQRSAHVVCMTDGAASHPGSALWPPARLAAERRRELLEAVRRLGGTPRDVTFLDCPDTRLVSCDAQSLAVRIADICRETGAHRLFSASPLDHHTDHVATADIARRAAALRPGLRLFFYPVWSRWSDPDFLRAHGGWDMLRADISAVRAAKSDALHAHRSQLGLVVPDAAEGFCLQPDMVRRFCNEDEFYFEVPPCP